MAGPRALSPEQVAKLTRGLAQDRPWASEFRKAYRPLSKSALDITRGRMRSGDRRLARAARAVRAAPTATAAAVALRPTAAVPDAMATVMGMHPRTRTGWNLFSYTRPAPGERVGIRALGESARTQHPDHVGNDWVPGERGEGPRGFEGWADHLDEFGQRFADASLSVVIRACPPGYVT